MAHARILVVDDDPDIALMVRDVLKRAGYEIRLAYDFAQAVERFGHEQFDLLITDKQMAGHTGFDLIRALRRTDPSLPAILMTGFPELATDHLAIQGYLAKPFSRLKAIVESVERTLQLSTRLKELRLRAA